MYDAPQLSLSRKLKVRLASAWRKLISGKLPDGNFTQGGSDMTYIFDISSILQDSVSLREKLTEDAGVFLPPLDG